MIFFREYAGSFGHGDGFSLHCKKYVAMHKNGPYICVIEERPRLNWAPTVK